MRFILILIMILLYWHIINYQSVSYHLMDQSYDEGNKMITNIKDYKDLCKQKIKYIKKHRSILSPANDDIIQLIENKIESGTCGIQEAIILTVTIPGGLIDYTPAIAYDDTSKKISFQLEQGNVGWYWLYGTFPNSKDCFLYQLTRVDLLPTKVRKLLNYKLGETTIYALTLGIGNGKDYYYGNIYFEGIFDISNNITFSITSKDGMMSFTHDYNQITVQCQNIKLINNKNKEESIFSFFCQTTNNNIMYFNQPNGCYPCQFNSSYQSYTNLSINMKYSNNKLIKDITNGVGWMDHQWGGAEAPTILYKSIISILNNGKLSGGLPPYIWINIRLSDHVQYMIYSFLHNSVKKGDIINCSMNTYQSSKITFFSNQSQIKLKVIDTVLYENTEYPTIYEVTIKDNIYKLK